MQKLASPVFASLTCPSFFFLILRPKAGGYPASPDVLRPSAGGQASDAKTWDPLRGSHVFASLAWVQLSDVKVGVWFGAFGP